jgi:small subunit ribosomal protein S5
MAFPRRRGDKKFEKDEYDKKTVDIRRVTRVTGGGKRFKFRITVVAGNKKGKIGVGMAKAIDISQAIEKAGRQAKKNIITIPLKDGTIPHEVQFKYKSAVVLLKPAQKGKGIIAGGAVRIVASLAGIENLTAKILSRTKNKLNIAKATVGALAKLRVK